MNDYELSKLTYAQALEDFGQPNTQPGKGDLILFVGGAGSHSIDEPEELSTRDYVIVARILEVDHGERRANVQRIFKYYKDGASAPESGEESVDISYFEKSTADHIDEHEKFFGKS